MLLIFFGGQIQVNNIGAFFGWDYIDVDAFTAGTITIGFIFGAYMGETFRGAFLAVPVGLLEAAYAYGMSRQQVFLRILVPQMMRHALPGLGRSEEHTSTPVTNAHLVCRLLLEKNKYSLKQTKH